jgi:hypothetical protein
MIIPDNGFLTKPIRLISTSQIILSFQAPIWKFETKLKRKFSCYKLSDYNSKKSSFNSIGYFSRVITTQRFAPLPYHSPSLLSHTVFLRSVSRLLDTANVVPSLPILVTLMIEAIHSSKT